MLWLLVVLLVTQAGGSFGLLDSEGLDANPPKIAVVGGGIGGTSAAFFLQEMLGGGALVDVYEPGQIGGRLATLPITAREYEVGGSIIHPRNHYMVDLAAKFGLKAKDGCDARMGLYNGEEFVFRDSSWTAVTLARLVWRYGLSAYKLARLTQSMLGKFERIYQLQAEGQAYKNVSAMISAMDPEFAEMMEMSTEGWLRTQGFGELMIKELVMAVTKCNYGQTPNIQAFVGSVAVAAADPDLWSVLGGNKRVAEELLRSSRASHLTRRVTQVAQAEGGSFMVTSVEAEEEENTLLFNEGNPSPDESPEPSDDHPRTQDYDMVILATPLTSDKSDLKLVNFTRTFSFPGRYERIVCTMVQGELRPQALNLPAGDPMKEILVTNPKLFYNSIGRQEPADSTGCSDDLPVWKVFSPLPLSNVQLDNLFPVRNSVTTINWLAYPHYEFSDQKREDFELAPGLYHISPIEWAGSAMEMSVIGGKNVALLAYKHWMNDPEAGGLKHGKEEL